jgi:hypothetical protein
VRRKAAKKSPARDARGRFKSKARVRDKSTRQRVGKREAPPRAALGRSLPKRVRDVDDAVRVLGRERIKRGVTTLGATRRLTPTRAGFRALDKTLLAIQRTQRGKRKADLFTFDLQLRYRDSDGNIVTVPPAADLIMPRAADVKRRRKKGESMAAAFRRLVEQEIKAAAFRAARDSPDIADVSDQYESLVTALQAGDSAEAKRLMREMRQARQLTFQITVKRVHS